MPTPKTKRDIVLQSTFSSTNLVATLNLGVDAQFITQRGTTTVNRFEDNSSGSSNEATEYQMNFGPIGGNQIGVITISFTGHGSVTAPGLTVYKSSATSSIDPAPTSGAVTPITEPDASYTRTWQQTALNSESAELVDQIGTVDVRVKAESSYRVIQTVTSTATAALVLSYSWKTASGSEVLSGTLTFTADSVAGSGYSLGTATATDNAPSQLRTRDKEGPRGNGRR